jgi:hypothetical protein
MPRSPDFLIIGAAKSGTTSLYFYLQQHPHIFMPFRKEPLFFSFENTDMSQFYMHTPLRGIKNAVVKWSEYQKLFQDAPLTALAGEASTVYLYQPGTAQRIRERIPNMKMIAILRNPVDRAYSHFLHFRRDGYEPLPDFLDAVKAESQRMKENWYVSYFYRDTGFYSRQLKEYYACFPKNQIKIFLYDDLKDSKALMEQIYQFLEKDPVPPGDYTSRHNISGSVRAPWLYKRILNSTEIKPRLRKVVQPALWSQLKARWEKWMIVPPKPMPLKYREQMLSVYKDDIQELQSMLNRDLSSWFKMPDYTFPT